MKKIILGLALVAPLMVADIAAAADTTRNSPWQFRLRAIDINPDESSSVNIGGEVHVDNAIVPEFDISYFFTDNIAAELILATAKHDLSHSAAGALGETWILPPTLTLQYHFTPNNAFSPYVGAGLNYSWFYGEDGATGVNNLDLDGGLGYALQAGFDYWLNQNWGVNVDVNKVYLNVDATLNAGAPVSADVDLDPWIMGAGVSYRF
jgi:outer membrane protein